MRELGIDRCVYAPDLPGHGSSDAAGDKATIADLADAVGDFIDGLRLRSIDILGYQLGTLVAAELAIHRPQHVRRIMLWGVPWHESQDRTALLHREHAADVSEDGSGLIEQWRRLLDKRGTNTPISSCVEEFADHLHAGSHGARALEAVLEYPVAEHLPLVKQQTLVLRLRDEYENQAARVRAALPNGSILDLPDYGRGFLAAAPQRFGSVAREFLDR